MRVFNFIMRQPRLVWSLFAALIIASSLEFVAASNRTAGANSPAGGAQAQNRRASLHHEIKASVDPITGKIEVYDHISLPSDSSEQVTLSLNANFAIQRSEPPLTRINGTNESPTRPDAIYGGSALYGVPAGTRSLKVTYQGTVNRETVPRGIISPEGVYLDGAAGWILHRPGRTVTFSLDVTLPSGWTAISQGSPRPDNGWDAKTPQQEVYLVAAQFTHYPLADGQKPLVSAYLRQADPVLADRYNRKAREYLAKYEQLLGPYPYPKFALVENFWQSGLGMPSFTLLGSRVIRLPFILDSSFPHEIVHNWWGNGVYVDYDAGNWSEGLTSYLADHLVKETKGQGAHFRRAALQKYRNYVEAAEDFSLRRFRGGHGAKDQAVGYNKMLMLTHMLRRQLGDKAFTAGLRQFYANQRFAVAGFGDLQRAMEIVTKRDLSPFFSQWVNRTGAPSIALDGASVNVIAPASPSARPSYRLRVSASQTYEDRPFSLSAPLVVDLEGGTEAIVKPLIFKGKSAEFDATFSARPTAVRIDPEFDVFRRLNDDEVPPSLGELFGRDDTVIVIPSRPAADTKHYRQLAQHWRQRFGWRSISDSTALPKGKSVFILGATNRYRDAALKALLPMGETLKKTDAIALPSGTYAFRDYTFVAVGREGDRTIGLFSAAAPESAPSFARRLPHYGRFGYAVFGPGKGRATARGEWSTESTSLSARFPPTSSGALLPLPAREDLHTAAVRERS